MDHVSQGRTIPINGSRPQDYPHRRASSRVHCIGWFDSGRVIDPIVLDGETLPERLHSGRDHRRVPFQPCEGNQSIFVTPTADHGVGVRRPSRWDADVARQIARRLLYGIDRQSPKPGLKGGSRGWINLDTKDANDHRKTGELVILQILITARLCPDSSIMPRGGTQLQRFFAARVTGWFRPHHPGLLCSKNAA